jgi:hypothetical protein
VRRPAEEQLECFTPHVYPHIPSSNWRADGANLRFKNLDLLRKFPRISGRRNRGESA